MQDQVKQKVIPVSESASSIGYGGQIGLFFDSQNGFKLGASYKTKQFMSDYEFDSKYLDGSEAPSPNFTMNYPAIYSIGVGFSKGIIDLAVDYRYVDYEKYRRIPGKWMGNCDASNFKTREIPTGAVNGFGWQNMSIVSAGLQLKAIEKVPFRVWLYI